MTAPFAFVAHRDGCFAGVVSPDVDPDDLRQSLADFATAGCTITPVASREEYRAMVDAMPMWEAA